MTQKVYTFITSQQEIISYWANPETYLTDGFYLLDRPRSIQPTREGQIMFIPLGFSVAEEKYLKMPVNQLYVLPALSNDDFKIPYETTVSESELVLPESKLILG